MDVNLTGGYYNCITTFSSCDAQASNSTVGINNGTNNSTSYPAPFGNYFKNAKHQFLFTASELQSAGVIPGLISKLPGKQLHKILPPITLKTFPLK